MKAQQRLIHEVQQFLVAKHNIKIQIPRLHNLIDSKINLKIWQPLSQLKEIYNAQNVASSPNASSFIPIALLQSSQNRYKILIMYIDTLLQSSNLDLRSIQNFMLVFHKIINTDIQIMQKNETIRNNSYKIKQKALFRIADISKKTQMLNLAIQKIHDKSDIISFIALDINNYLLSMKLIQQQYESVRSVEVHTPLRIDNIYTFQHSSEEDYYEHYQSLLQVLVKFRANMVNLQSSVRKCTRIEMPLQSVNLLANCKNLLIQLQQFLIMNNCSFNRLIFHVVTQQNQNMKIISSFYKNYLQYIKGLVFNVYKCLFLGHLFKNYYQNYDIELQQQRDKIIQCIVSIIPGSKYPQTIKNSQNLLILSKTKIKKLIANIHQLQSIICFGKTTIMQNYIQQKICKKLNLLLNLQSRAIQLQKLLSFSSIYQYQTFVKDIEQQQKKIGKFKPTINKYVQMLSKNSSIMSEDGASSMMNSSNNQMGEKNYKIFHKAYIDIQQSNLVIKSLQNTIIQNQNTCKQVKLHQLYYPKLLGAVSKLKEQYVQMQSNLLNSYKNMLVGQEEKQNQCLQTSYDVIVKIKKYLNQDNSQNNKQKQIDKSKVAEKAGQFYSTMGGDILNEDDHCNQVKQLLGQIDRAQYKIRGVNKGKITKQTQLKVRNNKQNKQTMMMISQNKAIQKQEQIMINQTLKNKQELQKLRQYLEWLLIMFQGSLDQNIMQTVLDRINFDQKSQVVIGKNVGKVQQLITQIGKYQKALKNIIKQVQINKNKLATNNNNQQGNKNKVKDIQDTLISNKILKVARQRLVLYQVIDTFYNQCLVVYKQLKIHKNKNGQKPNYNIEETGVKLFDKQQFSIVLLCYHCLNKMSIVGKMLNDSPIPKKTINYINDDLLQPFINRLQGYVKYGEEDVLDLVLRLEGAMEIQRSYAHKLQSYEKQLQNNENIQRIKEQSQQIIAMGEQILRIIDLDKKQYVVMNLQQMKKIQKQCYQHIDLAKQIVNSGQKIQLKANKQYSNAKIKQIYQKLRKKDAEQ